MGNIDQQEYFVSVYNETFDQLSRYVLFKSPSQTEAEDIVSAVYIAFYQYNVLKGKQPDHVLAYLIRMANHELCSMYKNRQNLIALDSDDEGMVESLPDASDLESVVFEQFHSDELWAAVHKLPDLDQKILIARYRFEMSFREIAEILGENMSEGFVRLRSYRAIKKLKDILIY